MNTQKHHYVFNRKRVLENIDGDYELLKELLKDFITNSNGYIENLRAAIKNSNATALVTAANALKGAASNLFADRVKQAAVTMEKIGESDTLENANTEFAILKDEMDQLVKELDEEISSNKTSEADEEKNKENIDEEASSKDIYTLDEINLLPVFNKEKMFANLEGNVELLKDLCKKFLKDSKGYFENIKIAIENKNASSLFEGAQILKSAASTLYAERVKMVAFILEKSGKSSDFKNADKAFSMLTVVMEQVEKELSQEISVKDQVAGRKIGIFELIDELRVSVEASFVLREALMKRLDNLDNLISSVVGEVGEMGGRISAVESLLSSKIIAKSPEQEKQIKDFLKRFKTFALRYAGHIVNEKKGEEFQEKVDKLLLGSKEQKKKYNEFLKRFKMTSLK